METEKAQSANWRAVAFNEAINNANNLRTQMDGERARASHTLAFNQT